MGTLGSLKGGFWRPSFAMRSFWFDSGMERSIEICSERSFNVASLGNDSVTGLPWCVRVSWTSSADVARSGGESVSMLRSRASSVLDIITFWEFVSGLVSNDQL
jgi:hypothetical protein